MAKKQITTPAATPKTPEKAITEAKVKQPPFDYKNLKAWLYDFRGQAIILCLLAFTLYCNTFTHEFAHDDGIVIVKNEYVLEGFAGIPNILKEDAYASYYRQLNTTNQLRGGRFRPLSIITFAIEQQFLGAVAPEHVDSVLKQTISYGISGPTQQALIFNMHVRHIFNTLWYMLSVVVLLYFLRYIVFKKDPIIAFLAAILFTVHPVHTEVVANVKSRDEIMSLLFMCLTFIYGFKYEADKSKPWKLVAALLCFFLAFLSKEYAITMLGLIPLAFYIFRGYSVFKSITTVLPYVIVVALYLAFRLAAVGIDVSLWEVENPLAEIVVKSYTLLFVISAASALTVFLRPAKKLKSDWEDLSTKFLAFVPYFIISAIYLREAFKALPEVIASASKEVLNNPYLYATKSQKVATELSSTMYYLKFLFFPHPLSADYSYNQIPYKEFSDPSVWISVAIHMALIGLMFAFFPIRKPGQMANEKQFEVTGKGIICFSLAFYFIHLLMINNLIFDIGATLGERLIYHSSVGFCIIIAWLLYKGAERIRPIETGHKALAGLMAVIVLLMGFKTIDRNFAWKNDSTLFTTDIKTVPNSVLVNANVAASYITLADYAKDDTERQKYLKDAVKILDHTLDIHTKFVAAYLNRGIAWYKLGDIDKTVENVKVVEKLYPTYPTLPGMYKLICDFYLKEGWEKYGKKGMYPEAITIYQKGLKVDSNNIDLWYNMGGAYYTNKQPTEAVYAFRKALSLQPDNKQAQAGLNAAVQYLQGNPQPQGQ